MAAVSEAVWDAIEQWSGTETPAEQPKGAGPIGTPSVRPTKCWRQCMRVPVSQSGHVCAARCRIQANHIGACLFEGDAASGPWCTCPGPECPHCVLLHPAQHGMMQPAAEVRAESERQAAEVAAEPEAEAGELTGKEERWQQQHWTEAGGTQGRGPSGPQQLGGPGEHAGSGGGESAAWRWEGREEKGSAFDPSMAALPTNRAPRVFAYTMGWGAK